MTSPVENPYVGPRAFTPKEQNRFFGRDREARELLSRVIAERLVLFYAQSGAGKTSLINTRLIPQLKHESVGYAVLPIGRVSGELPKGVRDVANIFIFNLLLHLDQSGDPNRFAAMSLKDFLKGLSSEDGERYEYDASIASEAPSAEYATSVYVLIIDQFEEIFTNHLERWQEREGFFRQLDEAMAADPQLWVVLSLREDYVAALDPYAPLLANRMRARFYMQRMGRETALEAVRRPAELYGRPFASGVAEQLVDNLRQLPIREDIASRLGEFVEPVQLQVVCYQLWEKLKDREPCEITERDVEQLGNVDAALADFYEQAIAQMVRTHPVSEAELREWFNRELITEARTRGTVHEGKTQTAGLANEVVKSLVNRYLLRGEMRAGGRWVELVHDRFVEPILGSNERWLGRQTRLVQDAVAWDRAGKDNSKLYVEQPLQEALASVGHGRQEPVVAAFLEASQEKDQVLLEREIARRLELRATQLLAEEQAHAATVSRWWARILGVAFVVALLLAFTTYWYSRKAAHSESSMLIYMAMQQNKTHNYAQGLLMSLKALETRVNKPKDYLDEAGKTQLQIAVTKLRERIILQHEDEVVAVAFSPNDTHFATTSGKTTWLWSDISTNKPEGIKATKLKEDHDDKVVSLAFNPKGTSLATASWDKTARLWDVKTGELIRPFIGHQAKVFSVAFSPDGTRLATASEDKTARLWDVKTGEPIRIFNGHLGEILSVAFSPDGTRLATASLDTAQVWNVETGELIRILERKHRGKVFSVAFRPNDTSLATASEDTTTRLWNAETGEPKEVFPWHLGDLNVAFSPDGSRIATASSDKIARLWYPNNELQRPIEFSGHQEKVVAVAFSQKKGTRLATASEDKTARIWDIDIDYQEFADQPHLEDLTVEGLIDLAKTKKPTLIDVHNNAKSYDLTENMIEKSLSEENEAKKK
jgi:hypothetical protein